MDKNRRGFMAALAGFFGLGVANQAVAATAIVPPKLEGFITFYVNVGSLPPFKAEAFIDRLKDQWKKNEKPDSLIKNWQTLWIPTRTEDTHTEFYPVNGQIDAEGKLKQIEGYLLDYEDKESHSGAEVRVNDPLLRMRVIDYVMLMLGAPVKNIDRFLVALAYDNVFEHIITTGNAANSIHLTESFIQEGTLAFGKMFVGRKGIKDQCGSDNALALYEEGRDEVADWTHRLEEMM